MTPLSRRLSAIFSVTAVLIAAAATLSTTSALAAGPAWDLQMSHTPGTLHRGEVKSLVVGAQYLLHITNTGDAPTSGPYTVTDTLPAPLTMLGPGGYGETSGGAGLTCTGGGDADLTGDAVLVCTGDRSIAPGEEFNLRVLPSIPTDTPDMVTNTATISGGGAVADATASDPTPVVDRKLFEVSSFTAANTDAGEVEYTVAGSHPFLNSTDVRWPEADTEEPVELLKDIAVDPVNGFFGNPAARPRCPIQRVPGFFELVPGEICPAGSRIGTISIFAATGNGAIPLFNVKPDYGHPAEFAFFAGAGVTVPIYATPRPRTESYGLTIETQNVGRLSGFGISVKRITTKFCSYAQTTVGSSGCDSPAGHATAPFLSNPVDCSDAAPTWKTYIDSWEQPGVRLPTGVPDFSDPNWKTGSVTVSPVTECDDPALTSQFHPSIDTAPLQSGGAQADQPAGLSVDLDFPQSNDPTDSNTTFDASLPQAPEPKDITVKLPAGLSISPSSASGLSACSDQATDSAGDQVHYDTIKPVTCPDSSKIGSAIATSPLLASHDPVTDEVNGAEPIPGDVYLIKPHPGDLAQGQDGKFRLLIQLENARYGINFKLPGIAVADKQTGQLTTVFSGNPQLPAKHLKVTLKSGPRAPLATPVTCGKFDTTSNLVPWSTPGTPNANPTASFSVGSGPNGSGCVSAPQQRPFAPALSAGTESSKAGASTPFVMKLTRNDGEQEFSSLNLTTPKGFSAKLAGVPYCPEAAIAAAVSRSGAAEAANPSCPAASQIGSLTVAAGPGSSPYYTSGKAYLAGPYKGAPLSFAFITPAVAGPFDLGDVLVRAAAYVNPETAQVTVKTDPIPQIIDGVPLRIRSIVTRIDRPNFTLNPTNCSAMSVSATIAGASGASASPSTPFQVGSCKKLGFKPKLALSLKGGTKRGDHPALKAVLTYPKGAYANIAKAVVALPHSEFLAQDHIKTICTRVQFAADACPAASIYGAATATTPLLDQPLSGLVYLRSSSNKLPDLVAALRGQIDVDLVGRIDSKNGGIRTTFDSVPDAPVSKFVLTMQGGKKGLLENSQNLCKSSNKASVLFSAQNGLALESAPELGDGCKKAPKSGKGHKRPGR